MQIAVLADDGTKEDFISKSQGTDATILFIDSITKDSKNSFDAFFILTENFTVTDPAVFRKKPVFINLVTTTLTEQELPGNFCRINAWPGFLNRELWEVAGINNEGINVLEKLQWKFIQVADEPGLVAARIISMIINEAYFALGEEVSSKDEIDLAMKLGTNYPYGPFEWSEKIGLKKIHDLLEKLSQKDSRYTIAPFMLKELSKNL